jgi:hypothetical protein
MWPSGKSPRQQRADQGGSEEGAAVVEVVKHSRDGRRLEAWPILLLAQPPSGASVAAQFHLGAPRPSERESRHV